MRKYFLIILLFIFSIPLWAENVSNIRVRQEGKNIVVVYDLDQKSVVRLLMASGESNEYTELKAVDGNVGKAVPAGKSRKIVWKPLEANETFIAQNVRFKVEAQSSYEYYTQNAKIKTLVLGQVGYSVAPQLSYGCMIGQMYKGYGWYLAGRSNFYFNMAETDLVCDAGGIVDGESLFYSGNKQVMHYSINAGYMMNIMEHILKNKFNTFGFYVGGGIGKRELQLETADGHWVKYSPTSHTGFTGNIGLFGGVCGLTINVGVTTIKFKYLELEAGIGYMF